MLKRRMQQGFRQYQGTSRIRNMLCVPKPYLCRRSTPNGQMPCLRIGAARLDLECQGLLALNGGQVFREGYIFEMNEITPENQFTTK